MQIGEKQVSQKMKKEIEDNSNQIGRSLGQPSVISELVNQLGMTHSMRPVHSEDDRRKIENCKGPAIKWPWDLYSFRGYCRGIGTRVGSPKRKQPFKTRMDRLGYSWAELGRCRADCSKAISRTECQQSAQAQPIHPLHRQDDHPIGPQLGRDGHWRGRFPRAIDPTNRHISPLLEKLTPRPVGGPSTRS